jgi:flagellin
MTSINTNTSAMSALQTLRNVNKGLESTQNAVSTGYKVASASDNAAYWSIATTMRSDNGAVNAASDVLGVGAAKVDVAYAAIESSIDVVNEIKTKLVSLNESTVDDDKVWDEVKQLQAQLVSIANSASFNGENWMLGATTATNSVVTGFVRTGGGVQVTSETVVSGSFALFAKGANGLADTTGGVLKDIAAFTTVSLASSAVATSLNTVETALKALTSGGSVLGSVSKRIDLQTDFATKLSDAIESGVSKLVDADMEEESARLSALQTQQQLAIQSLSIANSSSQNVLSLFR